MKDMEYIKKENGSYILYWKPLINNITTLNFHNGYYRLQCIDYQAARRELFHIREERYRGFL